MRNFFGQCYQSICQARVNPEICRATASTVLSVVYDLPMIPSADDPTINKVDAFNVVFIDYGHFGNYLVEFFPWMKYIPSSVANWKRIAEEQYKEFSDMFVGMVREVEDRIVMSFICFSLPPHSPIM